MHVSRVLTVYLLLFLIFVAMLSVNPIVLTYFWWFLLAAIAAIALFWRFAVVRYFGIALLILLLAIYLVNLKTPHNDPGWWNFYRGKSISENFIITSEPQISGKNQTFLIGSYSQNIKGNLRVSTNQMPKYHFGDIVKTVGVIKSQELADSSSSDKAQSIVAQISYPVISLQEKFKYPTKISATYFELRKKLIAVKNAYVEKIGQIMPEPEAGLLSGIIFGTKAELSSYVISILVVTGTVHIIALSGYNITIIANGSKTLTKYLGRDMTFWGPTIGIVGFVLATGLSASVVRAAIMGILLLLAARLGRQSDSLNAVLLASVLMAVFNPFILFFDVGFQLSFAAVLGILFLAPILEKYLRFLGPVLGPLMSATFAAQIFSWPIIAYYFGVVSLIGLLANALVLPIIPLLMALGFITASIGFISLTIGRILGIASWFMLSYILKITEFLGGLSFASISYKIESPLFLFGYFLLLLELIYFLNSREAKRNAE